MEKISTIKILGQQRMYNYQQHIDPSIFIDIENGNYNSHHPEISCITNKDGRIIELKYGYHNKGRFIRHNPYGPATIVFDTYTNDWINLVWMIDNNQHREDGPAILTKHTNGNINSIKWMRNGVIHRDDGPAILRFGYNGLITPVEYWFINGVDKSYEIQAWLKENEFPKYNDWTVDHKLIFKLVWI